MSASISNPNWYDSTPFSQAGVWKAVTPSDGVDLPLGVAKALWISTAGNLAFVPPGANSDVPVIAVDVGIFEASFVQRVKATGTTATGIYALY